ncbi:MAG: tetratricopeptide repeat protein [Pirellulaceae bacterium]
MQTKNADETNDAYAQRDTDAKKAVVVAVLDDFLQRIAKSGTPADAEVLRAAIDQYYAEIVANDPGRVLTPVPYLVRQGRRKEAVELTTKKENWEPAQFWTLFTACEAVLTDLDKDAIAPDAGDAGTPGSNGAETANLTAKEVRSQSAAIEAMLQNALVKYRSELDAASAQDQENKKTAVAFLLSLLANHDFNTGHADPQRYQRAVALYAEILALQPANAEAIQKRAMILAASGESLGSSLSQINQAVASNGPLPMVLDAQAMILLASGKPQEALEAARQVITERPDGIDPATNAALAKSWGKYYFHLALVYDANGNTAEAIKAFQEAAKLGLGETNVFALERPQWQGLVKKLGV